MKLFAVEGNRQKLDGGAMFGNAPKAVWEKWCPPDELSRIELACRSLLVQGSDINGKAVNVLFEAGIGAFFEPKLAQRFGVQLPDQHLLVQNLKELGILHEKIDYVVLSHLHFDHAGGIMPTFAEAAAGNRALKFPNAKYVVGERAWQRALNPHSRDRASFIPEMMEALKNSSRLEIVADGVSSFAKLPFVEFIYSEGHSPGQMLSLVSVGNGKKIFFSGDLIPGTSWVHVPITMGYDRYAELVIDEKQKIYERALKEKWWIFYTHDSVFSTSQIENQNGKIVPLGPEREIPLILLP